MVSYSSPDSHTSITTVPRSIHKERLVSEPDLFDRGDGDTAANTGHVYDTWYKTMAPPLILPLTLLMFDSGVEWLLHLSVLNTVVLRVIQYCTLSNTFRTHPPKMISSKLDTRYFEISKTTSKCENVLGSILSKHFFG